MSVGDLASKTIHELRHMIQAGTVSPREIVDDLLARIERLNPSVRAYTAMEPERVLRQLAALPARSAGKLHGIPITIKSNICVSGEETNCCSRILQGFRPPYDATVVERLRREGAVIVPWANMDEFAFGSSTENSALGPTSNPWDLERVPGGSSGGSAAAVAADLAIAALGSDTGGSIRQPASFCGVVGLKPTYGRVSRYGLVAFASSLDQIGPLTKDVRDAAIVLSVIAGHDERDSTAAPLEAPDYEAQLTAPLKGLRLGIPTLPSGANEEVKQAVEGARETLERLGLQRIDVELPHLDKVIETYYIIATAEASSNLARYDGVKYGFRQPASTLLDMYLDTRSTGFGVEAKRRILLGTYVLSQGYYDAYYLKGMKVRTLIKQGFEEAFARCDALIMPTAPTPAFRLGEKLSDPLQMYLSDIYTISANLAGVPALSLPGGFSSDGLPIGIQLLAAPFKEDVLLRVAHAYEQATEWHKRKPSLTGFQ